MTIRKFQAMAAGIFAIGVLLVWVGPASADGSYHDSCSQENIKCRTGTEMSHAPTTIGEDGTMCRSYGADEPPVQARYEPDVTVCVRKYDDLVFVKDMAADGHGAIGRVTRISPTPILRNCRNPYGGGSWARCDWEWGEDNQYSFDVSAMELDGRQFINYEWYFGFRD